MSYSFYVPMPSPPSVSFFDDLGFPDLVCIEDMPEGPLPPGYFHFYRDGISTRGLEVCFEEGALQVRIMTGSCREEYELALAMVKQAARISGAPIESEEGDVAGPDEIDATHGAEWIARLVRSTDAIVHIARQDGGTVTMSGPVRPFHLGPRMLRELNADDPDGLADRVLAAMRACQWVDPDRYYSASTMQVSLQGGAKVTLTAFAEGVGYVLPNVQFLAILDEPHFTIRRDSLLEVPGVRWRWLDEVQLLVEPIGQGEWPRFIAAARELEAPLEG